MVALLAPTVIAKYYDTLWCFDCVILIKTYLIKTYPRLLTQFILPIVNNYMLNANTF